MPLNSVQIRGSSSSKDQPQGLRDPTFEAQSVFLGLLEASWSWDLHLFGCVILKLVLVPRLQYQHFFSKLMQNSSSNEKRLSA